MAGAAVIGALRVTLGADTAAFEKGMGQAQRELAKTGKSFQKIGGQIATIGAGITAGVTLPVIAFGAAASRSATEAAQAFGQVEAALKSMGAASGRTGEQLKAQAATLQHLSTFDDDDILRKVTANLLTFGNVSGKVFDDAQLAIVNISARMGTDLQSSAIMVGKALNAPVDGLAALRRVGIQFTDQQVAQIKAMEKAGDVAGAQSVMLAELNRQFAGSAEALRKATPGADTAEAWRNFQDTVGQLVNNVLPPLTNLLTQTLEAFNHLSPSLQTTVVGAVAVTAAMGPLVTTIGGAVALAGSLRIGLAGLAAESRLTAVSMTALNAAMGPVALIAGTVGGLILLAANNTSRLKAENDLLRTSMNGASGALAAYEQAAIAAAGASGEGAKRARDHAEAMRFEAAAAVVAAKALRDKEMAAANTAYEEERRAYGAATSGSITSQANLTLSTGEAFNAKAKLTQAADRLRAANEGAAAAEAKYAQILNMATLPAVRGVAVANDNAAASRKRASQADRDGAAALDELKAQLDAVRQSTLTADEKAAEEQAANLRVLQDAMKANLITLEQYYALQARITAQAQTVELAASSFATKASDLSSEYDNNALSGFTADGQAQALEESRRRMVEVFDDISSVGQDLAAAFEDHDWSRLASSLASAFKSVQTAFKSGSTSDQVGAVAGVANAAGQAIGGAAGGALSGAASGAMAGATFGLPGMVVGAVVGGIVGAITGGAARKAEKEAARLKKREEELSAARERAAEAAQKLADIEAEHADLSLRLLEASGDSAGAEQLSRQLELNGLLDEASRNLARQLYVWEDYNAAVAAASEAVDQARSDLTAAYEREKSAIDDVRSKWQGFVDSFKSFAESLRGTATALLSPSAQTAALSAKLTDVLGRMSKGDEAAFDELQGVSEDYLAAGEQTAKTLLEQKRLTADVLNAANQGQAYASAQVDVADLQLEALNAQVSGLIDVNESVMGVSEAIANLSKALGVQAAAKAAEPPAPTGLVDGNDPWGANGWAFKAEQARGAADAASGAWGEGVQRFWNGDARAYILHTWETNRDLFVNSYNTAKAAGVPLTALDAYYQQERGTAAGFAAKYGLPAFATGGGFNVGGVGGIDSQIRAMRLTPGERVDISTPGAMNDNAAALRGLASEMASVKIAVQAVAIQGAKSAEALDNMKRQGLQVRGMDGGDYDYPAVKVAG